MAYSDGYYYGQCKIVAVVDNAADNGKTVLITTDDNKTYSGTIANKKCEFLVPPRTLYTVQKVSGESTEFTTKVEAGYGDCILVHLDTGYVEVKQGDIVGLDYIKTATDDSLKNKVPEAKAVKTLNSSLIANEKRFQFAYDASKGSYGYMIDGVFKSFSDATGLYEALQYSGLVTSGMTYEQMLTALANYFPIRQELVSTFDISRVNISHTMKSPPSVYRDGSTIVINLGNDAMSISSSVVVVTFAVPFQAGSNGANLNIAGYSQDGYGWCHSSFYVEISINGGAYNTYHAYNSDYSDWSDKTTGTTKPFNININLPANAKAYLRIRRGMNERNGARAIYGYITSLNLIQKTL